MKTSSLLLGLPSVALALPGMMGGREATMDMLREAKQSEEKRQLSSLIPNLSSFLSDVDGLVGSVAASVDPDNLRPEPGYEFQAPGEGDSRGPCPALNLLANYGYLPRNGYVTGAQVMEAVSRGFNMGADLAAVLVVFAVLADGDISTQSWYLGTGPGNVGGLNRHDTVEADISPNKEDYVCEPETGEEDYLGCGDDHHISSRLFRQNVQFASQSASKQFDYATMANQFAANADFSLKNNPYLYYFPFPSIVSVVAYNFYPEYFSNGTYGSGGVANYESISSIIGAQLNTATGQYEYVPERWPENWYRRATPYGAVEALTDGFTSIYPANPVPMPIPQLGNVANLNASTILCLVYTGIQSVTPLALAGQEAEVASGLTAALSLLETNLGGTIAGCNLGDVNTQTLLFPNSTAEGGPLNPPPSVALNVGNNVYDKTYFCNAPTTPQCSHTC
ncbi:hypothetical protein LTR85_011110 [Meristemomyces frigidus]|nr:hypothetical protein LTR85_011110 [Meristemomyces frigidus]